MGNAESSNSTNNTNHRNNVENRVRYNNTNQNQNQNRQINSSTRNPGQTINNLNTKSNANMNTINTNRQQGNNGNNSNHVYAKMTPEQYKEYQNFLLHKQKPKSKDTPISRNNNTNRIVTQNTNNSSYEYTQQPTEPRELSSSPNNVKDQFTKATNDRIYGQPNAPYYPQPRMNMSLQNNSNYSNVKDDYQNIYQQRQLDINQQYLHTLQQNGKVNNINNEFERTQHEMERMKKKQSLLFSSQTNQTNQNSHRYSIPETTNQQPYYQSDTPIQAPVHHTNSTSQNSNISNGNRHDAYVKNLDQFAKERDPYEMLNVTRDTPMREITRAYRQAAKAAHPDRGGDTESFNNLTKAYLFLLEENKGSKGNQNFTELKQNCNEYQKSQNSGEAPLGQGDAFNQNLFNKIYEENRLWENKDDGYSDWINEHKVDSTDIDPVFSKKFNLNIFNTVFNELKDKEIEERDETQLSMYTEPIPAYNGTAISFTEIGEDRINNFGKSNSFDCTKQLGYTDYRQAMTSTHLINPNNLKGRRTDYKNIDELERERDNISYAMSVEERQLYDKHLEFKQIQEDNRLKRSNEYDHRAEQQYHKVNNLLGQSNTKALT